jgi:putative DNA primase/helicase
MEWQRIGLAPPKIVTDATDEYFADQDLINQWLEDCTEDGGSFAFTPTSQLFASWKTWCDGQNIKAGSVNVFSDTVADRGFIRKKGTGGARGFRSLVLKTL